MAVAAKVTATVNPAAAGRTTEPPEAAHRNNGEARTVSDWSGFPPQPSRLGYTLTTRAMASVVLRQPG